jgi:osmotically-inducible protein OsmY
MKTNIMSYSLLGVIILIASVFANTPQESAEIDQATQTVIEHHLELKGLLKENHINVDVEDNVVILSGTVATIEAKAEAEQIAKNVAADYRIDNKLALEEAAMSDLQIEEAVTKKIHNYVFYTVFDWVTVDVKDGIVTLNGWSQYPWGIKYFAQRAAKVKGVKEVKNEIKLAQGSDELRYRAAQVIYDDPVFEFYVYDQDPPIHIIVNGASVILEGVLSSEMERSRAYNLVYLLADVPNVVDDLVVAKQKSNT